MVMQIKLVVVVVVVVVPSLWKLANVSPIPKESPLTECNQLRPISFTERLWDLSVRFAASPLACVTGGISRASAFVSVEKPWTQVAKPRRWLARSRIPQATQATSPCQKYMWTMDMIRLQKLEVHLPFLFFRRLFSFLRLVDFLF